MRGFLGVTVFAGSKLSVPGVVLLLRHKIPGFADVAAQQLVRIAVAAKLFPFGIPSQLPARAVSDVAEVSKNPSSPLRKMSTTS